MSDDNKDKQISFEDLIYQPPPQKSCDEPIRINYTVTYGELVAAICLYSLISFLIGLFIGWCFL